MAKNDTSWFPEDTSWRKTTNHGRTKLPTSEIGLQTLSQFGTLLVSTHDQLIERTVKTLSNSHMNRRGAFDITNSRLWWSMYHQFQNLEFWLKKTFDLGIKTYTLFLNFPIPPGLKRLSFNGIESDFASNFCVPSNNSNSEPLCLKPWQKGDM